VTIAVTLVPHTHWDREWYEPFSVFSERLVEMMDSLLDLTAEGFPHFHLDGQTAMIDDYLERRPDRAEELAARVRGGQLSAGPWVTQMDEFLTSGESHIRNLEMGLERAKALGGALALGYMPDQFGHIGQMPQLLRLAGLERAMVWRGVPFAIERDVFLWRSPDGSEVRTQYLAFGYFNGESFERALGPADLAAALSRSVDKMRPFMTRDRLVIMVGYDHAGPDATLPSRVIGAPAIDGEIDARIGSLAQFAESDDRDAEDVDLPVWTGELRSSARAHLLPNVYSARVGQKRERGRLEALVERYAEPLAALTPGFDWPADELRRAWTLLLWNGAHDSVCGCSHDEVAADVDTRAKEVRSIADGIIERALRSLGGAVEGSGGTIRFNPSPFEREGIQALGYKVVRTAHVSALAEVSIEKLPDGDGVRVDGVALRVLDEPDVGDLYNFCPAEPDQDPTRAETVDAREADVEWIWPGVRVLMRISRREDEPFVRLEGTVYNERADHRLRLHVELPTPVIGSLAGSPFELAARPLVGEGSDVEEASPTWPARHLAVASDTAVLHEGVFEYEVTGGRSLVLSLQRSVGRISAESLATRPWAAGPQTPTPGAQLLGETAFSIGVWAAAPIDDTAALLHAWERFALPIVEAPATGGGNRPLTGSLMDLRLGDAQLSNIRRREEQVEVRLWNPRQDRGVTVGVRGRALELGPARIQTVPLG
jgi:alpha-mannosidase